MALCALTNPPPPNISMRVLICSYEMRAYVLATPFHVAKMASHDDNAYSLPFAHDIVAAREEDEAGHRCFL